MHPAAQVLTYGREHRLPMTMKIITAVLLLLTLGLGAVITHHDDAVVIADRGSTVVEVAHSQLPIESASAGVVAVSSADAITLTTVCVFVFLCCVLLAAVRLTWGRVPLRKPLAVASRGLSRESPPSLYLPVPASLSQLSVSRT